MGEGKQCILLHLGDHDPSGIDMTRDNQDRLDMFDAMGIKVDRVALNMDQIEELNSPPNPAKFTDSRIQGYIARFGQDSWELDALDPQYIKNLITDKVLGYRDSDTWQASLEEEARQRDWLSEIRDKWEND
jgi:hypothetical protein